MFPNLNILTASQAVGLIRAGDSLTWIEGPYEIRGKISAVALSATNDCLHLTVKDVGHKRSFELHVTPDVGLDVNLNPMLKNLVFLRSDDGNVTIIERKGDRANIYFHSHQRE